ncbi:cold shock domain protein CspD [Candidatus Erwinia dacicola]|uniref:Cold shock-like protein CspD n=1 Tax=Candidatus Erwinia dacicola TaxID=252393 RepID=A0A328TK08_9GAMM|nr:cold shock domain protein CspD [Candidatus Erwinia dacicola]
METGTVRWFNNAKAFGFICLVGSDEDIFAHYSSIKMDGYRTLKAGQQVQFDVHEGPKGNHASLIVAVEETMAISACPFTIILYNPTVKYQPLMLAFFCFSLTFN